MKLELKKFDITNIRNDNVVVLIGKRGTGKSFLVKDLLFNPPDTFSEEWFDNRPDMLEPEEWVIIANRISSFIE